MLECVHDQILFEGPHSIAAIVLEAITGANGWLKTPTSFIKACGRYVMSTESC